MKTKDFLPGGAELLLAGVIVARATSYLFSKLILEGMGLYNLLALRFSLAFLLLAALFFRRLRGIDRKTLRAGCSSLSASSWGRAGSASRKEQPEPAPRPEGGAALALHRRRGGGRADARASLPPWGWSSRRPRFAAAAGVVERTIALHRRRGGGRADARASPPP